MILGTGSSATRNPIRGMRRPGPRTRKSHLGATAGYSRLAVESAAIVCRCHLDGTAPQQNPTPNVNMAQFTSASSIPRNQQGPSAPEPANLNASQMAGGNSGANPMFNTSSNQHVQFAPSKPIEVAAGALTSSLIKRTLPIYPEIARNSHVSGVVTVAITITPQGTVAEAHAVSGPVLLRPAAVNAVKNWRFRPYSNTWLCVHLTRLRIAISPTPPQPPPMPGK